MTNKRVVYSTDQGNLCPDCGQPVANCSCGQAAAGITGPVKIRRQTRGRAGKPVSIITGLPLPPGELKKLARELKTSCGVGGSIEGGDILIQGDQRDQLRRLLEDRGYTVKLAGG